MYSAILLKFIQNEKSVYIVISESKWENSFSSLPMTKEATDFVWKKSYKKDINPSLILKNGIKPYLEDYSKNYILFKAESKD